MCLLDRECTSAIERLASTSGARVKDKLKESGLGHTRGVKLNVPIIEGAQAAIECRVNSKKRVGDHLLLLGLVRACYASTAFSDFWDFQKYKPILYTGWREGMTTFPGS